MRGLPGCFVGLALLWPTVALGYGEPVDGYPTMDELWVEVMTSSCRQDPEAWGWPQYAPVGPLWHDHGLNEVARNHSQDMADKDYFEHDSIDGTSWDTRIMEYYDSFYIGENIAAGYWEPLAVLDGWLHSDGHRENIYTDGYTEIGVGVGFGGSYGIYWTQDFGGGPVDDPHPVPAAAAAASADGLTLWAILYDGGEAAEVWASVEDTCTPMDLIYGRAGDGTYEALVDAGPDDRWTIQVRLTDGDEAIWPDRGAWDTTDHDADATTVDCLHPGTGDDDLGDDDDSGATDASGCACAGSSGSPFLDARAGFAAAGLLLVWRRRS